MTSSARAAVTLAVGAPFEVRDIVLDSPAEREVLVEVRASGLCHTDLTMSRSPVGIPMPAVFGHEISGVVIEVGPTVSQFTIGDHVVGCLIQYCGACSACLSGDTLLCLNREAVQRGAGDRPRVSLDGTPVTQIFGLGGFASHVLVHENQLTRVPRELPFAEAAVIGCAVVTGAGAVLNSAAVRAGDDVVVVGAGGVGLNAVRAASLAGAEHVIAVDLDAAALVTAQRFGATHTVDASGGGARESVRDILPRGADAVFDFVGVPAVTQQNLGMVARGGGFYIIGLADPASSFGLSYASMIVGQTRVHGVDMGGTSPRRDIPRYARLFLQGRWPLTELVSRRIDLGAIGDGYRAMHEPGVARVVVTAFDASE